MHTPDPRNAQRLVVAMSGGVDSTVTAWMLQREGKELVGLFMRNGVKVDEAESCKKACCSVSDARDARMVAAKLGIPFHAVDLKREFRVIIDYFLKEYSAGRTPNPCAVCNRDLKLDALMRFADEFGCEGVATGHYARIEMVDGRPHVRRGVDHTKDQSYQLFCVAEANLARTHLPLGGMQKSEVRALAAEAGLRTAAKRDSQEICFVPSNDYRKLLEEEGVELHPGTLVDTSGKLLGTHEGTEHFTIGQRRGHGVGGGTPLYVVEVHPDDGRVVLGTGDEATFTSMQVNELNWIGFDVPQGGELRARVQYRYHCTPALATIGVEADGSATVQFDEPQLAVASGQGAAFYDGDRLLGGGWIGATRRALAGAGEAGARG
ncbi:MAG: tRNA 2-thiouridine(34) synthase MnmA [Planctomycetes bacterium]|nr:tRNA 2-thiouridine(34) synthase MnmA [Planctomycetota bacterium]